MNANTIWALVAGLAVGLLVGRELPHGRGGSSGGSAATESAGKAAEKAPAAGIPKELPADLAKLIDDMKATDKFAGMTTAQKYVALKALNDTPCDCGCPHGSSAKCIAEDPNCPVAPKKLTQAIDLAKQGKSLEDIAAAIKKKDGGGNAQKPAEGAPQKVDLAAWTPVKGPKNAKVTVVAFSDFQCPFCSRVVPTMKQLEKDYEGRIRIAFKHRPLPFHDKAHLAAQASLAANAQGKFWEMHDALFANQQELDRAGLDKRAGEIGLNMDKFKKALDGGEFKAAVDKDNAEAEKVGAGGTPTFFINGNKLVGAQPVDAFKTAIDAELAKKK